MAQQQTIPTNNAAAPAPAEPPKTDAAPKAPDAKPATLAATPEPVAVVVAADEPTRALSAFSNESSFKTAQRMANALSSSSLVPEAYKGNIPNVLIAMELANRIGASVFMVMQNLDIIHGRPGWRSQFLIATVNASGRFTPLRFRWSGTEGKEDWGCRCVAKDRQSGEECIGSLITIKLARQEQWLGRKGSKWETMPEQMMMYRAAAFWTRVYAPELSLGMQTREEIVDTTEVDIGTVPLQKPEGEDAPRAKKLADEIRARAAKSSDPPPPFGTDAPNMHRGEPTDGPPPETREPGQEG